MGCMVGFTQKDGVKRADVDSVFANPRGSRCQGYRPVKIQKNRKNLVWLFSKKNMENALKIVDRS